uniref:protein angel homolog 1 isoform X2 n=1 Tax=Monopterus albus TaxID=43700 RepID=UPI0009B43BC0|nr:protein angel homolog 1-like isoform X2 [Monopterus albus]
MTALHKKTTTEAALKICEGQSAVKENEAEMRNRQQQDNLDIPKQDKGGMTVHPEGPHKKPNREDGGIFPIEELSLEQTVGARLKCLQTEDSIQDTTCQVQEHLQVFTLEGSVLPTENSVQDATCPVGEQIQKQRLEESVMPDEIVAQIIECWDEYAASTADGSEGSSSHLVFDLSEQHNTQTGWHFPAGPGLAEEVHCPLRQFPALSSYPPLEQPFEVVWRVWRKVEESITAAEPTLLPFPFTKSSMDFTAMSYNIMAQDLLEANRELYTHCPLEVLDWSYRCTLLLEEIEKWAPDILCLQEVQENHYHEQLHPALSQMGYTCVYKRRTGTKTDGCAICYRNSCFSVMSLSQLEFYRPETEISGQEDLSYKTHCSRLFAPLWPSSLGITDNCQYTTAKDKFQKQNAETGKCQYSHDFMLQLHCCPAACVRPQNLVLIPGVTDNTPDASRRNQPYDKRFRHTISHQLDLESVYKHILPGSGPSEVTTLNSEVGATVDYMFYSPRRFLTSDHQAGGNIMSGGLKLTGCLSLLSEDVLWSMNGLPNHIFPSDHLSLVAKFQLDLSISC